MHETAGARLKQAVADHWPRMTLRLLGERLGERADMISGYVNGRRTPPIGFWRAAEKELGLREGELTEDREQVAA